MSWRRVYGVGVYGLNGSRDQCTNAKSVGGKSVEGRGPKVSGLRLRRTAKTI